MPYNVWSSSRNCKCQAHPPQKNGRYYEVSFTQKGKGLSNFVKDEDLPAIREQLRRIRGTLINRPPSASVVLA